jgi:hypothetical protein
MWNLPGMRLFKLKNNAELRGKCEIMERLERCVTEMF